MKLVLRLLALTILLGAIALTGFALFTSRFGWPIYLELFSHFQAQYFGVAVLLTALLALLRQPRMLLIGLFCVALLSAQIVPWYFPTAWSPGPKPANYRVLAANLNVRTTDAAPTLALVAAEQPDLALLMEVNETLLAQLEPLKTTLPYTSNQSLAAHPGMVIYSKTPLTDVQVQLFGTQSSKNITARLQVNNQPLVLVAVHPLPPVRRQIFHSRNRLLDEAAQYVQAQSDPVLFLGDLNTTLWSPYYRRLAALTKLKNARDGFGLWPTWPTQRTYQGLPNWGKWFSEIVQIPIDHCLVSPEIQVAGFHTGAETGSDHLPIIADVLIGELSE